ncbi:hypothetical protein C4D60_Mb08t07760 [Musa balbisiana]|uniref:RRM domain-containing protein n=1 Tax=Musa balbisiana TaxID=52838 RepID=A0A4S8K260_MUSBA|nr:hypothetical protein C4D60_Mb08t07760 [Musa balbisiana]
MTPNVAGQFGDTTYTKIFVGGLAWETQSDTMRNYFEQFGEILEAVVITDKSTGRSKGYGFVTFREPAAAMRACVDPSPVIDGRRANCNLASLGAHRSTPTTPPHGGNRSLRMVKSFHTGYQGGMAAAFASPASFPHYAIQQGAPYGLYGYSPYSSEYSYPMSYYNVYGGATAQYPAHGSAAGMVTGTTAFYPYFQFGQGGGGAGATVGHGYSIPYPPILHYSAVASTTTTGLSGFMQHLGGPLSIPPSPPAQPGMTVALTAPALPSPAGYHHCA